MSVTTPALDQTFVRPLRAGSGNWSRPASSGVSALLKRRNVGRRQQSTNRCPNLPPAKRRNVSRTTALEIVVVLPPLSRFGGSATIVPAPDYVSTFRGEGVEPDLVALPVGLRFDVSRG
jgi:hypothetical protein